MLRCATWLVAWSCFAWCGVGPAQADESDGVLTVTVVRDLNLDGAYDPATDPPEAGIEIAVTDAGGATVTGTTDSAGRFLLAPHAELTGGRYFVVASVPASSPELTPAPESESFVPFSTTVDLASDGVALRMAVRAAVPSASPTPAPGPPTPTQTVPQDTPLPSRFAVGGRVWQDANRSGQQEPAEPGVARVSVQLLDAEGDVVDSTTSDTTGRYVFDGHPAGIYAVRFAGVPADFRFTDRSAGSDRERDSDADSSGLTAPFRVDVGEPGVRATRSEDSVTASRIKSDVDAGTARLRYAVSGRAWLDENGDGIDEADEPGVRLHVALLTPDGSVRATTESGDSGGYRFADLDRGRYRLAFSGLPAHRMFALRKVGNDPAHDSDVDPKTGITALVNLDRGAAQVHSPPAGSQPDVDLENPTVSVGLVGSYTLGDTVWQDTNANGVLDASDTGVSGVRVELLDAGGRVVRSQTTTASGRFTFARLPGGAYRVRFRNLPAGLVLLRQARLGDRTIDSDPGADGITSPVTLSDEHPVDTTVAAGLVAARGGSGDPRQPDGGDVPPSQVQLGGSSGVPFALPLLGYLLSIAGALGILLGRLRRR